MNGGLPLRSMAFFAFAVPLSLPLPSRFETAKATSRASPAVTVDLSSLSLKTSPSLHVFPVISHYVFDLTKPSLPFQAQPTLSSLKASS